jgi:peptide/nickel transport system permease protein
MIAYLLRRLGALIVVLFGITLVVFVISRVIPTDVARLWAGQRDITSSERLVRMITEQYHLDKPILVQYSLYVRDMLRGDMGISVMSNRSVWDEMRERIPNTVELGLTALLLAIPLGVVSGVLSATRRNSWLDHGTRLLSLGGVSIPVFWLGLLFQMVVYYQLALVPSPGGRLTEITQFTAPVRTVTGFLLVDAAIQGNARAFGDAVVHLLLPGFTLALPLIALISRMTRSSMLEEISKDYVRTARAKGLAGRTVNRRHALRNALLPVATIVGISFGSVLTGSVVTELVYYWPGLGRYAVQAILAYDTPAIMAFTVLAATVFALANLTVDLLYAFLDPRIRYA